MLDFLKAPKKYAREIYDAGFVTPENNVERFRFQYDLYNQLIKKTGVGEKYIYDVISELGKISKKERVNKWQINKH